MKRKIAELILVFLLFFFIPDVIGIGTGNSLPEGELSPQFFIAYTLIGIPKILLVVYILMIGGEGLALFGFGKPAMRDVAWTIVAAGLALSILMIGSYAITLLPAEVQRGLFHQYDISVTEPSGLGLAALFCIVVAYKEELFFRSYLYRRCLDFKFPEALAVLVPSLIFSLFHLAQGWFGVGIAFAVGLALQLVFRKTRNLHVVAAAHFLYNFSLMVISFFGVRG